MKITIKSKRDLSQEEEQLLIEFFEDISDLLSRKLPQRKFNKIYFNELRSFEREFIINFTEVILEKLENNFTRHSTKDVSLESISPKEVMEFKPLSFKELVSRITTFSSSGPDKARPTDSSKGGEEIC